MKRWVARTIGGYKHDDARKWLICKGKNKLQTSSNLFQIVGKQKNMLMKHIPNWLNFCGFGLVLGRTWKHVMWGIITPASCFGG